MNGKRSGRCASCFAVASNGRCAGAAREGSPPVPSQPRVEWAHTPALGPGLRQPGRQPVKLAELQVLYLAQYAGLDKLEELGCANRPISEGVNIFRHD